MQFQLQPFRKHFPKPVRKSGLFCYNILTPKLPKFPLPKITPNREEGRAKLPINFQNSRGKHASKAQKESMKKQKRRATTYFGIAEMDRSSYVCGFKRLYATNVLCVDC